MIKKLFLFIVVFCLLLAGCSKEFMDRPTQIPTLTLTPSRVPTRTSTNTLVPTITLTPSQTPTKTNTPYPTRTHTNTSTLVVSHPAEFFEMYDAAGRLLDWEYAYVSEKEENSKGETNLLTAMLTFQLMDRGIHSFTFDYKDEDITVFYLNVRREFNGVPADMCLILTGTQGRDIKIKEVPADGSAYISYRNLESSTLFEPWTIHADFKLPFNERKEVYSNLLLYEFEEYLPSLPDELIVLAEHPVLWPKDDWSQLAIDMERINSLTARYYPFLSLNDYDQITGPSNFAIMLTEYLLEGYPVIGDDYCFSAENLILLVP
jgi:hypothetical protein